jgi:hypothetical protein
LSCEFWIHIIENNCWSFSAKFHEYRLQALTSEFSDDSSDVGTSSEVDLFNSWVLDECFSDCSSIFGMRLNDIQDSIR